MIFMKIWNRFNRDNHERLVHIENKENAMIAKLDEITRKMNDGGGHKQNTTTNTNTKISKDENCLYLAFRQGGGIGDALLDTLVLKAIKTLSSKTIVIDFYSKANDFFGSFPFINHSYNFATKIDESEYDLILTGHRLVLIDYINEQKVKTFSKPLFDFCIDSKTILEKVFSNQINNYRIEQYCLIKGKNRIEQPNPNNILPLNRNTKKYIAINPNEFSILENFGLLGKKYIVINNEVDSKYNSNHPKLWQVEKYDQLTKQLKTQYPDIMLVQVGSSKKFGTISHVDLDLVEKTSLEQVKIILKNSMFLLSSEGGLVHIQNFLYGKSVVIFGPTSPEVFGYEENINIRSSICPNTCEWLTDNWCEKCILGNVVAPCTDSVSVSSVFEAVIRLINSYKEYDLQFEGCLNDYAEIEKFIEDKLQENQTVCFVKTNDDSLAKKILEKDCTIDSYNDNPKEKCFSFSEFYGDPFSIPSLNDAYNISFSLEWDYDTNYYFGIKELMRITKPNGFIVIKASNPTVVNKALMQLSGSFDKSSLDCKNEGFIVIKKTEKV